MRNPLWPVGGDEESAPNPLVTCDLPDRDQPPGQAQTCQGTNEAAGVCTREQMSRTDSRTNLCSVAVLPTAREGSSTGAEGHANVTSSA